MISVSVAVLQIENNFFYFYSAIIKLILICTFTATRTLIHESVIKVYIQNFYNRIYKSKERKKIRFMSNQYLCLFPYEPKKKFKPPTCQLISHPMNISDILSCSTN